MSNLGPSSRADGTDGDPVLPVSGQHDGAEPARAWWVDALLPLLDESWWNHL